MKKGKGRLKDFLKEGVVKSNEEPVPDVLHCLDCGLKGGRDKFLQQEDGDWESGYYEVDICPNCEYSEVSYEYSDEHFKLYLKWEKENK